MPLIALGSLQPGRPLIVVLDPADPKKFVIDWSGNSAGPPITFQMEDGRTANLSGDPATTAAVLHVLQKYGIEPANMDLRGNPQVRKEVLAVIQRAGYLGAGPRPGMPTPVAPTTGLPNSAAGVPGGDDPDPAVRLNKLAALRDAGTITPAEFEQHRLRILSDI
ncbi:MAG: SHOCT domain-containing protein [Geodermatophilaceae bacterium]